MRWELVLVLPTECELLFWRQLFDNRSTLLPGCGGSSSSCSLQSASSFSGVNSSTTGALCSPDAVGARPRAPYRVRAPFLASTLRQPEHFAPRMRWELVLVLPTECELLFWRQLFDNRSTLLPGC